MKEISICVWRAMGVGIIDIYLKGVNKGSIFSLNYSSELKMRVHSYRFDKQHMSSQNRISIHESTKFFKLFLNYY